MRIIVQKFGGTSVASSEGREKCRRRVTESIEQGYRPVVVVSAMGRKGQPYATDTLIELAGGSVRERELDLVMSCGEVISAVVFCRMLQEEGYPCVALTGGQAGIITDNSYTNARILKIVPDRLNRELADGKIVVVAGFQGITSEGEITTLGRGGSDTTAAALAAALKAELAEIYTDVDGVMTADPRVVPEARVLTRLSYQEIMEMAHLGAKVIHPRAVEIAMEGQIPLAVKGLEGRGNGTLIGSHHAVTADRVVTGITHLMGLAQFVLRFNEEDLSLAVFQRLGSAQISIDLIQVNPGLIAFTVLQSAAEKARNVLGDLPMEVEVRYGFAKVSAVGGGMRGVPGVMARVVAALNSVGVRIHQTADSHANISCLVEEKDAEKAVRALHDEFNSGMKMT